MIFLHILNNHPLKKDWIQAVFYEKTNNLDSTQAVLRLTSAAFIGPVV